MRLDAVKRASSREKKVPSERLKFLRGEATSTAVIIGKNDHPEHFSTASHRSMPLAERIVERSVPLVVLLVRVGAHAQRRLDLFGMMEGMDSLQDSSVVARAIPSSGPSA